MSFKEANCDCSQEYQNTSDAVYFPIQNSVSREILFSYPNFNKPFVIHTDSSEFWLGAVISQDNKPITFYSKKLNSAQVNYTTTKSELLSIEETLKEFRNILH